MFKSVHSQVWAFDCEWVPDPRAGRILYSLSPSVSDEDVIKEMWRQGGATEEDPMPYLKTAICRIVSISALIRKQDKGDKATLEIRSLPQDGKQAKTLSEAEIIDRFLHGVGKNGPQLVGFNSANSDLNILVQRAVANGVSSPQFAKRPDKPWEGRDYFARSGDWHIDLMEILGTWGKGSPSLHQMAVVSGIPGKLDLDGQAVTNLWLAGEMDRIINYNECDAVTTYLLWLRLAHFGGYFSSEQYQEEQILVRDMLRDMANKGKTHFARYLELWDSLEIPLKPKN